MKTTYIKFTFFLLFTCALQAQSVFETENKILNIFDEWYSEYPDVLNTYGPIDNWNISDITNKYELFNGKNHFNNWDTAHNFNLSSLFDFDLTFNLDKINWNISKSINMNEMLYFSSGLIMLFAFGVLYRL